MFTYRVTQVPADRRTPGSWIKRNTALGAARLVMKLQRKKGKFLVFHRGHRDKATARWIGGLRSHVRSRLRQAGAGNLLVIEHQLPDGRGGKRVWVRKVKVKPPWTRFRIPSDAERDAHKLIKQIYKFVHSRHPGAMDWGTCVCRRIDGSTRWSQHSRWVDGCRATDVGVSTLALGDKIVADVRANATAIAREAGMSASNIGWIWRTTAHWDHIHFEVRPTRSGIPRCAGGPA